MTKTDPQWRIMRPRIAQGADFWKGSPGEAMAQAEVSFIDLFFSPMADASQRWTKMRNQILNGKLSFEAAVDQIVAKFEAIESGLPVREWAEGFVAAVISREAWLNREMARELREKADALVSMIPQRLRQPAWEITPSNAAAKTYVLTDGQEIMATRVMTADEHKAASRQAREATDGTWQWGEAA